MSDELQELQEHAEHAQHHPNLAPVSLTMAALPFSLQSCHCWDTGRIPRKSYFRQKAPTSGRTTRPRIFVSTKTNYSADLAATVATTDAGAMAKFRDKSAQEGERYKTREDRYSG